MGAKRMMMVAALATGLGVLGSAPAFADDTAGLPKAKNAKDDPSRRVCRNLVPIGTRLSSRVCKTQAEWDRAMDKTQEGVLQHQMSSQSGVEQGRPPF